MAVAIKGSHIGAVPGDVVAAKVPHGTLILEANWHGYRKPVLDILAPQDAAVHVDFYIVHVHRGHVRHDIIRRPGQENDTVLSAALVQSLHDHMRVIIALGIRQDVAKEPIFP